MNLQTLRKLAAPHRASLIYAIHHEAIESHTVDSVCAGCGNRTVTPAGNCAYCGGDNDQRMFGGAAADELAARTLQAAGTHGDDDELAARLAQTIAGCLIAARDNSKNPQILIAAALQISNDLIQQRRENPAESED